MINVDKISVYIFLTLVLFPIPHLFVCLFSFLWPNLWFVLHTSAGPSPCWSGSDCCKEPLRIIEILSMWLRGKPRFSVTPQWGWALSLVQVAGGHNISLGLLTFLTLPYTQPEVHKTNKSYKFTEKGRDIFVPSLGCLAFFCFVTVWPVQLAFVSKSQWWSCMSMVDLLGS